MSYYEILGIEKNADKSAIKKAYYLKARQCHPDKNPDDPNAEELFKAVSEAYTILTDDEKKKIYDKYGKDGLSAQGQGGPDPTTLFKMMFGGGYFENEFGELSVLSNIMDGGTEGHTESDKDSKYKKMAEEKEQKNKKLEVKLLIKLEPHLSGNVEGFKQVIAADIADKVEAPGGPELLKIVGNIYLEKAKQYQGRFFGFEGFFSSIAEKASLAGQVIDAVGLAIKMAREMSKLQQIDQNGGHVDEQTQANLMKTGLNVFWTMGKIEIDRTVHAVCEAILTEAGIPEDLIKKRATALRVLGEMYLEAGTKAQTGKSDQPFDLPEQFFAPQKKEKTDEDVENEKEKEKEKIKHT